MHATVGGGPRQRCTFLLGGFFYKAFSNAFAVLSDSEEVNLQTFPRTLRTPSNPSSDLP